MQDRDGLVEASTGFGFDPVVHRVEVAALCGGRIGVVEDLLYVEQVKYMAAICGDGVVEDASGAAA